MQRASYDGRDYSFGQAILTLRTAIGLTQAGLADYLGVSRRTVGAWEAGSKYPKAEHLKQLISFAVERHAFQAERETEEVRSLWQAAHQKVLLDEVWLAGLLAPRMAAVSAGHESSDELHPTYGERVAGGERSAAINLPFQPTPFIGRAAELTTISSILGDPACRLLTLLGPGGIGKTRLGIEAAAMQASAFDDGVVFVALAPVGTPPQIVSAIGEALNLHFAGHPDPTAYLLEYLRELHMLLLLDNFEHLLAGADLVRDILAHAPRVTLLVTSRERLNLQSEWLFDVEGLTYPTEIRPPAVETESLADISSYSAVQLFAQRARQVQPGFLLSAATLSTIVRICQQVVGMPLAIELAAASVRLLPIAEIERQIRTRLDTLGTTLRDLPERHRSMRAVFDQSWNLLSEPEREMFSRLAVFRGGCTAEAAEQITGATLPTLAALVDKSLARQITPETRPSDGHAMPQAEIEPRFLLLEPIREYALAQLAAHGEEEALRHRHANYYLALAEAVAAQWDSPTAATAADRLDSEYDNMRAALQWARDGGELTVGLRLAVALRKFWQRRGYYREARQWLDDLLALEDQNASPAAMAARFRALHTAAWLASDQVDYARATQLYEQSMVLYQVLAETEKEANLLTPAARQARAAGQYARATVLLEDVLARHRALGNRGTFTSGGLGLTLYELGLALREQGNFARATALFEECLQLHRDLGDREGMSDALLGLADIARDKGHAAQLRAYTEQSLVLSTELGLQWARGFALNNLALAAYLDGDISQAFSFIRDSIAVFRSLQADSMVDEVLITLGHILRARGDGVGAYEALSEALRLALALGPRILVPAALEGLASLTAQWGAVERAVQLLAAASAVRAEMGTPARPLDRLLESSTLANARSTLGDTVFEAQWEAGKALALEDVLSVVPNAALFAATPLLLPQPQATLVTEPAEGKSTGAHASSPPAGGMRAD